MKAHSKINRIMEEQGLQDLFPQNFLIRSQKSHTVLFMGRVPSYLCVCVYIYMCLLYTHACLCPQRPKECVRSPATGITGSFKPLDVTLGTELWYFARAASILNGISFS